MANYLPVLLVSLNNAIPDDSSLTTAPRAQVDYLSHDWEEEDVWRSWRNMTRQKNAIANGARLENASWRTWWKQRNNLGTVSPETLNWLKDSDVTWLYGPLHTAEEWKPPTRQPSPLSNPAAAAPARPNSPSFNYPRRSNGEALYKPILKHRSISELLTSELPVTSPVFSPIDSEEDSETTDITSGDGSIPLPLNLTRPALLHTKSDTILTRWGSSRTFRRGSPSRVSSPETTNGTQRRSTSHLLSAGGAVRASHSLDSNSSEKSAASGSEHSQSRHKKKHISFNTFVEQFIAIDKPKKNASGYFCAIPETPWTGGRTAWVDETGYEEDEEDSEEDDKVYVRCSQWMSNDLESSGPVAIREDSDSPDDDDDDAIEIRSTRSTPTPKPIKKPLPRSQSKVSTTSSSSSASTSTTSSSRSDASTSLTTDDTSPSGSLSPSRRISSSSSIPHKNSTSLLGTSRHVYRRSSTTTLMSTYRPSLHRIHRPPLSRSPLENTRSQHVTIAPIAPTLLKTTPTTSWTENLGDDGGSSDDTFAGWAWGVGGKVGVADYARNKREDQDQDQERDGGIQRRRSWTSGYGADSYGFAPGAFGTGRGRGTGFGVPPGAFDKDDQGSEGTPVELVYVPPFEYIYPDEPHEAEDVEGSQLEEEQVQIGERADIEEAEDIVGADLENLHQRIPGSGGDVPSSSTTTPIILNGKSKFPTMVVDTHPRNKQRFQLPSSENEDLAQDPYDYFGGPDMGDDYYYYSRRGGRGPDYQPPRAATGRGRTSDAKPSSRTSYAADWRQSTREQERNSRGNGEERRSRSRSQSHSRTPSPALLSSHNSGNSNESGADGGRSKSTSSSASNGMLTTSSTKTFSQSDLLPLPSRGRRLDAPSRPLNGVSPQDGRRGRSSTRTSSSSCDKERGSSSSLSSTSPMGSLSPDGIGSRRGTGPCVLNGMGTVLETAGKEKDREVGERCGRERTSSKVLSAATANRSVGLKSMDASFASSSSSSSNASTIMPRQVLPTIEKEEPELVLFAEETLNTSTPSWGRTHSVTTMSSDNVNVDIARTTTPNGAILQTVLSSSTSTPSPTRPTSKLRPPLTLRPTPPSPAKPRTSFAAVSPTVTTPTTILHPENTIVGKAVDIVSSAGLYLGLWARERSASAPSSPT